MNLLIRLSWENIRGMKVLFRVSTRTTPLPPSERVELEDDTLAQHTQKFSLKNFSTLFIR